MFASDLHVPFSAFGQIRQVVQLSLRLGRMQASLERATLRADSIVARVDEGRGTVGRLVNDPALYVGTDSLVMELRALVADIKKNPKRYVNVKIF